MRTTSRRILESLLFCLIVGLLACSREVKRQPSPPIQRSHAQPAPAPAAPLKKIQRPFGDIGGFTTENVKRLLSTTMNPDKDLTLPIYGIAMNGDIHLAGGEDNPFAPSSASAQVASTSEMAVYVIDDAAKREKQPVIIIGFMPGRNDSSVSGEVLRGRYATIKFNDKYGGIILDGMFDRQNYQGTVSYTLNDGVDAQKRFPLGNFRVPTCGFFHC
jgi:hypothetical protein